jgi:DNA-binding FadR family transcriptional regulator
VSRYADLADALRQQILSGELTPGVRLPTEPELCELHGVSRSTVREALRVLSSQGLVETVRGVTGGTFVAAPTADMISDNLRTSLRHLTVHDEVGVQHLLEVRDLLEVPAAGLAADRAQPEQLEQLRATLVDPVDTALDQIQAANHRFHALLVQAADNPLLDAVATPVFGVLVSRAVREPVVDVVYWQHVVDEHRAILEAVQSGDADLARQLMADHLHALRATYALGDARESRPH